MDLVKHVLNTVLVSIGMHADTSLYVEASIYIYLQST